MGKELQENAGSIVVSMKVCLHPAKELNGHVQQDKNIGLMEYHQRRVTRLAGLITYRIDILDGEMKIEKKKKVGAKLYKEKGKVQVKADDFRTRLRSCGRGLIAGGYAGEDDNGFQFFFTLGSTSELQNKHTIFGKVTGETIYNMLKLEKAPVDENDRLLYPPRLLKSIILNKPFSVIISRTIVQKSEEVKDSSKTKTAVVNAMKERVKNKLVDAKKKPKIVENYKIDYAEDDKDIMENE
ncbi:Peptidyl-prolyl cis-trans isomerase CWC27 like protein [Eufriesea mexicana]|uniref:Spliceosome-associated protein CWC27 homolog n=1 Tax=Eufriesea mexicana TaxID=516756 RepID=A0A310SEL0_9HYME|nr:Peptidyl-prolyl cis-trans isomerase CWC27 like protein [Eufriesea mexicana]